MALQASGQISFSQIAAEMGGSPPYNMSNYYRGGSYTTNYGTSPVPASGQIGMANFYGAKKNPCATGFTVDYGAATCQRTVVSSYQWTAQGYASGGPRRTGNRSTYWETTLGANWEGYTTQECNAANLGNTVGDGSGRGGSYGDIGEAWPRYRIVGTVAQVGRPNPNSGQSTRSGGTVYWYQCTANTSTETQNFADI